MRYDAAGRGMRSKLGFIKVGKCGIEGIYFEGAGIGQTSTTLFDARGKLGRSMHTLFIRPK